MTRRRRSRFLPALLAICCASLPALSGAGAIDGRTRAAAEESTGQDHIRWLPWTRKTFEVAAALKRPVLLYLRSADCRLCSGLEANVFDDPDVVRLMANRIVPIAADVDLRPDLASRYLIRAVPTVSYLLPNGEPMYRIENDATLARVGAYMTSPDRFRRYLALAVRYMKENPVELIGKAAEIAALESKVRSFTPGDPPLDELAALQRRIRDQIDYTHGGLGRGWKTIDDAPFRLFASLARDDAGGPLGRATMTTAHRLLEAPIHDAVEGGFHHYATARDWSTPALEKRLDTNAAAVRLLVVAAVLAPEDAAIRAGVSSTIDFVRTHLALDEGGYGLGQKASLTPDDPGLYFTLDRDARQTRKPPGIVRTFVSEYNARFAVALLEAGARYRDTGWTAAGLDLADVVARRAYRPGRGVSPAVSVAGKPSIDGLLVDQVAAMEAWIAAFEIRGRPADLERVRALAAFCDANLRDPAGFYIDRSPDLSAVGKMKRPMVNLSTNGRLALALLRLSVLSGDPAWRERAVAASGALRTATSRMGAADAPYVEALGALAAPPIRVVVPGAFESSGVLALRQAGMMLPEPGAVVVPAGAGAPVAGVPAPAERGAETAWVCVGEHCSGPVTTSEQMRAALASLLAPAFDPGSAAD
ncbi:MAG: DUF255 domain-containing protein [Acidobacteriota bacterium]